MNFRISKIILSILFSCFINKAYSMDMGQINFVINSLNKAQQDIDGPLNDSANNALILSFEKSLKTKNIKEIIGCIEACRNYSKKQHYPQIPLVASVDINFLELLKKEYVRFLVGSKKSVKNLKAMKVFVDGYIIRSKVVDNVVDSLNSFLDNNKYDESNDPRLKEFDSNFKKAYQARDVNGISVTFLAENQYREIKGYNQKVLVINDLHLYKQVKITVINHIKEEIACDIEESELEEKVATFLKYFNNNYLFFPQEFVESEKISDWQNKASLTYANNNSVEFAKLFIEIKDHFIKSKINNIFKIKIPDIDFTNLIKSEIKKILLSGVNNISKLHQQNINIYINKFFIA